jgi:polyferredoxin
MRDLRENKRQWRKSLRYLRWVSKAVFLLLFVLPVAYLAGAPRVPVYSFLFGGLTLTKSFGLVPITQSVCSVWTSYFGNMNSGAWILCPFGAVQYLLTGQVAIVTIVAMLLFIIPIVLLGNVFCSWVCPIGTIVDSFDKGIEKFFPKVEAKRRSLRRRQSKHNGHEEKWKHLMCPACPLGKVASVTSKRSGVLANGILASALVGSAALRFPVFCAVCPIGILTRGYFHLRSIASITGTILPLVIELWAIPIVAVLASLRERRFWCKKLCPVGALLRGAGALSPFIKPKVKEEKCVMCRKCEKVCPMDINLVDHGSFERCTKCLECYIVCDLNAVKIDLLGKPEVFRIGGFFRRLRARRRKDQITPIENRREAAGYVEGNPNC